MVAGLQLEEESPLRAARLPDHRDDCLFWTTPADNERPDQEPTDRPRTSCIIYSPLLHLGFLLFYSFLFFFFPAQTLGLAFCRAPLHRPTLSRADPLRPSDLVHLQRWRVLAAPLRQSAGFHLAGRNKGCRNRRRFYPSANEGVSGCFRWLSESPRGKRRSHGSHSGVIASPATSRSCCWDRQPRQNDSSLSPARESVRSTVLMNGDVYLDS